MLTECCDAYRRGARLGKCIELEVQYLRKGWEKHTEMELEVARIVIPMVCIRGIWRHEGKREFSYSKTFTTNPTRFPLSFQQNGAEAHILDLPNSRKCRNPAQVDLICASACAPSARTREKPEETRHRAQCTVDQQRIVSRRKFALGAPSVLAFSVCL